MGTTPVIWCDERSVILRPSDGLVAAHYYALAEADLPGVAEVVPGSRTLLVRCADGCRPEEVMGRVLARLDSSSRDERITSQQGIEVPVCYDTDLGPDLEALASSAGLSVEHTIGLHVSGEYTVRFLGFSPGFPYLDGLPEALHAPRLDTPRPRVRSGSVGIAGSRTGIYPQATPGGWRLIGVTPFRLFDPARDPPALLAPGDRVRFRRIDRDEFDRLAREHA